MTKEELIVWAETFDITKAQREDLIQAILILRKPISTRKDSPGGPSPKRRR
jgi:hypothetical protein